MRIHVIQHASFEGPAYIQKWALKNSCPLTITRLYQNERLPALDSLDLLVLMGGPMSVNDTSSYTWIEHELAFINKAIQKNKAILGICLGAQLIAKAIGGEVIPGRHPEIGWFPIWFNKKQLPNGLQTSVPEALTTFHWHGETFSLPADAFVFASSRETKNQGFIYGDRIIGLQFHPEATQTAIHAFIKNVKHEIVEGKYIQTENGMLEGFANTEQNHLFISELLSYLSVRLN